VRNVSERVVDYTTTHILCSVTPPPQKTVPCIKQCGKLWKNRTGHRWQSIMDHALCTLNN